MEPYLHSIKRDLKDICYLLVFEPLKLAKYYNGSIIRRELVDKLPYTFAHLLAYKLLISWSLSLK